ncbi:MAG: S8 family serine peptidase [Actinobacteria bacterium]|nr:S8 family serine peptidase [Actinomycetota bacterium]
MRPVSRTAHRTPAVLFAAIAAVLAMVAASGPVAQSGRTDLRSVIVVGDAGAAAVAEAVESVGGEVGRVLGIIGGVAAEVPADRLDLLEGSPGIVAVTDDRTLEPRGIYDGFDHAAYGGSMHRITANVIEADELWKAGYSGAGVDVAVIDTGVAEVPGLDAPGKVLHGPDLSFESQDDTTSHIDTYGHGTAMAGLIAGRDTAAATPVADASPSDFLGVAPDARIVSVKVGDRTGATDVSQVIAAIDWVVQHRNTDGLNIRVLNLSYGTDGDQDYGIDPLAYAAEVAWRKGIVVVAAAGNSGNGSAALDNPAYSPHVIAVGAADGMGTDGFGDDEVPAWSSCGDGTRNPDLVAPGTGIVGLRAPGTYLDEAYPAARKSDLLFRGSGSSQSTAIVSGAAALLLQQRPHLTPADVKTVLTGSAKPIRSVEPRCQGAGQLKLASTNGVRLPGVTNGASFSTGVGSLEASRGAYHVVERVTPEDGTEPYDLVLEGEQDIFGQPWDPAVRTTESWNETSWSDEGDWNTARWTGTDWDTARWTTARWTTARWTTARWTGSTWTTARWTGDSWTTARWTTPEGWGAETLMGWSTARWTGDTWDTARWTGDWWGTARWTTVAWHGARWG